MKKVILAISAGLCAFTVAAPAMADGYATPGSGSIKINKDKLDKVEFNRSPLRLQVLDTRPIVSDLRTPERQPDTFEFRLQPLPAQPGSNTVYADPDRGGSAQMPFRRGLPMVNTSGLAPANSMFETNVPRHPVVSNNLPQGHGVPIAGPQGSFAGPPRFGSQKILSGSLKPGQQQLSAVPVRTYGSDYRNSAVSTSRQDVKTQVSGTIRQSPLIGRLQQK